jgi:hypothetical protein
MSDADQAHFPDFGKLVPGFDFLKNLSLNGLFFRIDALINLIWAHKINILFQLYET